MSGTSTPPSESALPLRLALAHLVVRALPMPQQEAKHSPTFIAGILHIIGRETLELCPTPASFEALLTETDALLKAEAARISRTNGKHRARGQVVSEEQDALGRYKSWLGEFRDSFVDNSEGSSFVDSLERDVRDRIGHSYEDDSPPDTLPPVERHTHIGLFCRNLSISLRKLSFDETAQLARRTAIWCGIPQASTSAQAAHGHSWSLNIKAAMEDTLGKRVNAMAEYQSAARTGDYSQALASLRRFYDYQFPSTGRAQHQYALLSLAAFHFSTEGYEAAMSAVTEAIRVARSEGDRPCLQQCMSLLHRLEFAQSQSQLEHSTTSIGRLSQPSHLPKPTTVLDELATLQNALHLGEPVPIACRRIYTALARSAPLKPDREAPGWMAEPPLPLAAWHASQAGLWNILGSAALAEVHENMALQCPEVDDDSRLTILLAKAERASAAADFDAALGALLRYDELEGMSIADYRRWAAGIWTVLDRRAALRENEASQDLIRAHRPAIGKNVCPSSSGSALPHRPKHIRQSLRKAQKLLAAQTPPHLVLPHVLTALQLSRDLALWPAYRFACVLLGEVLLLMDAPGMTQKAISHVEEVWDQVHRGGDEEAAARGAMVLGKGAVALAMDAEGEIDSKEQLSRAVEYLRTALRSARKLGSRRLIMEASALLAMIAELGGSGEGEQLAGEWEAAVEGDSAGLLRMQDEVRKVAEIVKLVGVRVAEGWR